MTTTTTPVYFTDSNETARANGDRVLDTPNIGDGATVHGYSDSAAYTVIAVSHGGKRVTLQRDNAKLLNGMNSDAPDKLIAHVGGFCAHVEGVQRYEYTRNTDGPVKVASLTKRGWRVGGASGSSVTMGARREHYDYNF